MQRRAQSFAQEFDPLARQRLADLQLARNGRIRHLMLEPHGEEKLLGRRQICDCVGDLRETFVEGGGVTAVALR